MLENIQNTSDLILYQHMYSQENTSLDCLNLPVIYMVLSGSVRLISNGKTLHLGRSDLVLINSYELFSLEFNHGVVCKFILNLPLFQKKLDADIPKQFSCICLGQSWNDNAFFLKSLLAEYAMEILSNDDRLNRQLLATEILRLLCRNFPWDGSDETGDISSQSTGYIHKALNYMQNHFREPLTVGDIAGHCYISVPYLSRLFKDYLSSSVYHVLTRIRLSNARSAVLLGSQPIEEIASDCGFPNSRAFTQAFLKEYNEYPSKCRKNHTHRAPLTFPLSSQVTALLSEYILDTSLFAPSPATKCHISVDTSLRGQELSHHLWSLLFIGDVRYVSNNGLKRMLPPVQRTFHYKYAYISGLLTNVLLQTMGGSTDKNHRPSFIHIDTILEILMDNDLIPCIDFGCVNPGVRELPELSEQLMAHLLQVWGLRTLEQWLFIPAGCPYNFFDSGSDYLPLTFAQYKQMIEGIRKISPSIQIGSPLVQLGNQEKVWQWLMEFTEFCRENHLAFDFYSVIHYPLEQEENSSDPSFFIQDTQQAGMEKMFSRLKSLTNSGILPKLPVYVIEWNTSISQRDFTNDCIYKAPLVFRTLLNNYDKASCFGFSLVFDGLELFPVSKNPIHGGRGMMSRNGIKKPSFWAIWLLYRMGNELLSRGDGYFISRKDGIYQIYLYNDVPIRQTYAESKESRLHIVNMVDAIPIDHQGRPLSALATMTRLSQASVGGRTWDIRLCRLQWQHAVVTTIRLTQQQCSVYTDAFDDRSICPLENLNDYWNAMTTPKIYSKRHSLPTLNDKESFTDMEFSFTLAPGEIAYIEIEEDNDPPSSPE